MYVPLHENVYKIFKLKQKKCGATVCFLTRYSQRLHIKPTSACLKRWRRHQFRGYTNPLSHGNNNILKFERRKHGWWHTPSQDSTRLDARLEEHFISGNNEIIRVVMDMCVVMLWCCVEYVFCVGARKFWFGMRNEKIKIKPKSHGFCIVGPVARAPRCQVLTLRWRNSIQLNSRNAHFFALDLFFSFCCCLCFNIHSN